MAGGYFFIYIGIIAVNLKILSFKSLCETSEQFFKWFYRFYVPPVCIYIPCNLAIPPLSMCPKKLLQMFNRRHIQRSS